MSEESDGVSPHGAGDGSAAATRADKLLQVICHDLRSPLSSIVMGADFLRKSLAKQEAFGPEKRILESMVRSANRLTSLIADLHDVAHIGTGQFSVEKKPRDVGALMTTASEKYGSAGASRGVKLEVGPVAAATFVVCDYDRVLQALGELVENGARYAPANGSIRLGFEVAGDQAIFSVTDDGSGMSDERAAHAFDHSWHASQSPRDGTGLGLTLVRGIANAHGGDANVETQVGRGTRVSFWLPRTAS
jgi:signal transduction histidine kinase